MQITPDQKRKITQVINAFETGKAEGDYSAVARHPDGPKGKVQISYGRSQATEYGELKDLLELYIFSVGKYSEQIKPYVNQMGNLHNNQEFVDLLIEAGKDPVMQECQDEFFDDRYFKPAEKWAGKNGFKLPLSLLVIYDSFIHSGGMKSFLIQQVKQPLPYIAGDEKKWITEYVRVRKEWLATHKKTILRKTIYRMECFEKAIGGFGNWDLSKPIFANG